MSEQTSEQTGAPPDAVAAPRRGRRSLGLAAIAALGIYLVLVLVQVIETVGYVAGSYTIDIPGYLAAMVASVAPGWFLGPLPYAIVAWLGLGLFFAIRSGQRNAGVIGRALLTSLLGLLVAALVVAIVAFVGMFVGTIGEGTVVFSADVVIQRFRGIIGMSVNAVVTLLTVGTLAVIAAALLLRDALDRRAAA